MTMFPSQWGGYSQIQDDRAIAGVIPGRTTWHVMGMGRNSRTQYEPTTLRDRKRGDPKEKTEYSNDEKDDYELALST
ncbi:hypothetical protein CDAR_113991 [Caerostris darwini]|uniref:Uncharacterized protein n=1 Tax=Caerostris darwini TaxID=1538125 RepID=A0AAV4RYC1_9ARAC|nr:hypothetical protein CDAR_113991 [Caerostris darwini]